MEQTIEAVPFGEFYMSVEDGFIIKVENNKYVVMGVHNYETGQIRRHLTPKEFARTVDLGLVLSDEVETETRKVGIETRVPLIQAPSLPTVQFPSPSTTKATTKPHPIETNWNRENAVRPSSLTTEMERENVLQYLKNNPGLLDTLIELARFEKACHYVYEDDRPCVKNGDGHCDDCYSDDTEFDHKVGMSIFFKKVSEALPSNIPDLEDSDADEDEE